MHAHTPIAKSVTILVVTVALLSGARVALPQTADNSSASRRFDAALVDYERNHWPQAFSALSGLADAGHREAARIAWQMWRFGPALYGQEFAATPRQIEAWLQLQACADDASSHACTLARRAP